MAWRFVLDGEDVSSVAADKKCSRELNGPAGASCRIPTKDLADITGFAIGTSRLKVYDDENVLWHHGIVWNVNDDGDENTMRTVIQSVDPMALWPMRPARDPDGDFSYPSFFTDEETGPQIMQTILEASVTHEGPLFLDLAGGVVDTGGVDLSGTPVDWPMTIMDVFNLLIETGKLDVVLAPVEGGSELATFNAYNGNYGSDLSGSVVFQYRTGSHNVRRLRRAQSMAQMANKQWYLLGPKKTTLADPDAVQHWRSNVTGDHPALENPPGGDVDYPNPLGDRINQSRDDYWVAMDIRTFDTAVDSGTDAVDALTGTDAFYLRMWQAEQSARVGPRTVVKVTPVRGTEPSFDVGDLVTVQAGAEFRGGLLETQRVYRLEVSIDNDGVVDLGEIMVSGDQETS